MAAGMRGGQGGRGGRTDDGGTVPARAGRGSSRPLALTAPSARPWVNGPAACNLRLGDGHQPATARSSPSRRHSSGSAAAASYQAATRGWARTASQ